MKQLLFLLFVVFTGISFAQEKPTGNAWVKKKMSISTLPGEVKNMAPAQKLSLVLLGKNYRIIKPSGRQYLLCYLVNHTGKNINISRADEKLNGLTAEIFENKKWVIYQVSSRVFCGNSFWTQTLEKGKALLIYYDYAPKTSEKTMLRLAFGSLGSVLYSNTIAIEK